jgi:hypothetical protein
MLSCLQGVINCTSVLTSGSHKGECSFPVSVLSAQMTCQGVADEAWVGAKLLLELPAAG